MLIKESKEVLKQTIILIISVFFLIYPIYLIASIFTKHIFVFSEYFLMFYQLFIFFFSFFLGISLFSKEIRNNGFEYLLTLPFSRTKLLLYKIVPRIIALALLYLIYLVLLIISKSDPFLISPVSFISLYFSLFFISTSLSVLRGNFVGNSIFTGLMFIFFLVATNFVAWLVIIKYFGESESFKLRAFVGFDTFPFSPFSIISFAFLISIPFIVSLFYGFKKFDIRSSKRYLKRFSTLLIPLILIGMIISYFILNSSVDINYDTHYMTRDGVVIKHTYSGTSVVSGAEERELPEFYPHGRNLYEREGFVYLSLWHWEDNPAGNIIKFDKTFSKSEIIHTPAESLNLGRKLYGFRDTIVFLEHKGRKYSWNKSKENRIVFLNIKSGEIKRSKFPFDSFNLLGVTEVDNSRVWIGYYIIREGVTVYTIDGSGNIKNMLRSTNRPMFINNELITFGRDDLIFGRFSGTVYEELKRVAIKERLWFSHYLETSDLNMKSMKYLYAKIHKRRNYDPEVKKEPIEFISIDLNNHDLKRFYNKSIKRGFLVNIFTGDTIFIKFTDDGDILLDSIFRMNRQEMVLLKNFKKQNLSFRTNFRHIGSGFVTGKGDELKFYKYPDMKELKY